MIKYLFVIGLLAAFFSACKKSDETTIPYLGYNYFPVNIGHELIYDADSIITDEFTQATTIHRFQIKEIIDSVFNDLQGRPTQRIVRYVRDSVNHPWTIFKVWSATLTNTRAERYEDNVRYVKLVFPVKEQINWNGNSLNSLEPLEYEYTEVNSSISLNNLSFDSVLTVLQEEEDNIIEHRYFMEQYATGVGMIYKENTNQKLDWNNNGAVIGGYIYKETLKEFTP